MDPAREETQWPTMLVRLKNTVRILVEKETSTEIKKKFGRDFLVLEVLRGVFGMSASLIFCLQDFASAGFMDLTFFQLSDCVAFNEAWGRKSGHPKLAGLKLIPAFAQDFLPLTVHMYNPFVEDGDVLTFLARYCDSVKGGERLKDRFGIWNGKRRYLVKLRADAGSPGGIVHPPGSFFIGSNRGYLHYPGQPVYCRKCGAQGHVKADCVGQWCRHCGSAEHEASGCPEPKTCSLCGKKDHLFRTCPRRQKSYASLFKERHDLQADFDHLLESQEAGPSGEKPVRAEKDQTGGKRDGGGEEQGKDLGESSLVAPSQEWSEFDVTEALRGMLEETEEAKLSSDSAQQQEGVAGDAGLGMRRRRPNEKEPEERERKCTKLQPQEDEIGEGWEGKLSQLDMDLDLSGGEATMETEESLGKGVGSNRQEEGRGERGIGGNMEYSLGRGGRRKSVRKKSGQTE